MSEYVKLFAIAFSFIFVNTLNSRVVAHGDVLASVSVGVAVSVLWFNGVQSVVRNRTKMGCACWIVGAALGQWAGIVAVKSVLGF